MTQTNPSRRDTLPYGSLEILLEPPKTYCLLDFPLCEYYRDDHKDVNLETRVCKTCETGQKRMGYCSLIHIHPDDPNELQEFRNDDFFEAPLVLRRENSLTYIYHNARTFQRVNASLLRALGKNECKKLYRKCYARLWMNWDKEKEEIFMDVPHFYKRKNACGWCAFIEEQQMKKYPLQRRVPVSILPSYLGRDLSYLYSDECEEQCQKWFTRVMDGLDEIQEHMDNIIAHHRALRTKRMEERKC